MKLSKLTLVQHFSKLYHCVVLTFDHLVQLLGLKTKTGSTKNVSKLNINSVISPVQILEAGLFQNSNLDDTTVSLGYDLLVWQYPIQQIIEYLSTLMGKIVSSWVLDCQTFYLIFPAFQSFLEVLNCTILLLRRLLSGLQFTAHFIQFFLKNLNSAKKNSLVGQWFLLTSNATMKSFLKSRFKGFLREYYLINFSPHSITIKVLSQSARESSRKCEIFLLILSCFNSRALCFLYDGSHTGGTCPHESLWIFYTKTKELLLSTTGQDTTRVHKARSTASQIVGIFF